MQFGFKTIEPCRAVFINEVKEPKECNELSLILNLKVWFVRFAITIDQ